MGDGITLPMWQFILSLLVFVATCVTTMWGGVKYLIGRQDKQIAEVFSRIETVRAAAVSREEYLRDSNRLHDELRTVREAVERQGTATADRMDRLLLEIGKASGKG